MTKTASSSRLSSRLRRLTDTLLGRTPKWKRKQAEAEAVAVITPAFDRDFYLRAHSQGTGGMDPVLHYVRHGYVEFRDPSPDFSTAAYVRRYADVRRSGVNPFEHYLTHGRAEGRIVEPSARRGDPATAGNATPEQAPPVAAAVRTDAGQAPLAPAVPAAPRAPEAPVRVPEPGVLAVVTVVEDQADIVRAFAAHALQLFDRIVFVDRGSSDGTLEFLTDLAGRRRDVSVYRLDVAGDADAAAVNHLIATAKDLQGADWVVLLAADRFLPFADGAGLRAGLDELAEAPIVSLPAKTLLPETYGDLDLRGRFLLAGDAVGRPTIAIRPMALRETSFWVDPAAGTVAPFPGGEALATRIGFDVLRIPVRSADQLSLEIARRSAAKRADVSGGPANAEAIRAIAQGGAVTPDLLDAVALAWDTAGGVAEPLSRAERIAAGHLRPLETVPAMAEIDAAIGGPARTADLLLRIEARAAARASEQVPDGVIPRLVTTADRVLQRAPDDHGYRYQTLAPVMADDAIFDREPAGDDAFVREFLQATYWPIVDLTPTAWAGHIPFMYALVAAFRPRRFVELGSHHGASFFAFCHAARRTLLETSAVAVDCWEGDSQTGFYGSTVFDGFRATLEKYRPMARYERMFFDDAAKLFEDGSVDLLHIDGLHTYEAVTHDYETWLPKMSDRGLIIFHDINVHERDFGVWQFWERLRSRHPTMELRHSHGLGVAYVGRAENTRIGRMIDLFGREGGWKGLLQHHLERVSESNLEVYRKRDEVTSLKTQLDAARVEAQRLRQEQAQGSAAAAAERRAFAETSSAQADELARLRKALATETDALLRECVELAKRR